MTQSGAYPIPPGRGRWRLTLHNRQFGDESWQSTILTEFPNARGRRLEQQLNTSAQLTFTLDGRSDAAAMVQELEQDVIAWRWDDRWGVDVPYFRGIIGQAEDQLSEQSHVVTITCHDYIAMLTRRHVTNTLTFSQQDQDSIVAFLMDAARNVYSTGRGQNFIPGSYLPLYSYFVAGDGSGRSSSGQLRDRTYQGSAEIGQTLDDLAHVINGFDYDAVPAWRVDRYDEAQEYDYLRIFYPSQGVVRTDPILEYGGAVSTVTRTVTSGDYANFDRVLGNAATTDPNAAQLFSEKWNADANNVTVTPIGLWMNDENAADVSIQSTLDQTASGTINLMGVLVPSYTLGLRPEVYYESIFNVGDTVPVIINSGRLAVNTTLRIVGLTFDIGDDGQEDVSVTVGRSKTTLANLLTKADEDVNALARR